MGRSKSTAAAAPVVNKIGWRANSKDGKFLEKILKSGKLTPGITPGALKEIYPRFLKYKNNSFASGLCRMKAKLGINVRGDTGKSIV